MSYKQSYEVGLKVEDKFKKIAKNNFKVVKEASRSDNIKKHIDFYIGDDKKTLVGVDVKARKKISRGTKSAQEELFWIEIKNVSGKCGWLFGEAHWICFEYGDGFLFVDRTDLLRKTIEKTDFLDVVTSPHKAIYKIYNRKGRLDILTLLKLQDVLDTNPLFVS